MNNLSKALVGFGSVIVITLVGLIIGYYTSPTFKNWVDINIFKQKEPEPVKDETEDVVVEETGEDVVVEEEPDEDVVVEEEPDGTVSYTEHQKSRFYQNKTNTTTGGDGSLILPAETSLLSSKALCTADLGCLGIQRTCTTTDTPDYPNSCPDEYRRWVVANEETTPEMRLATIGGGSPSVVYIKN
jgi:hypothetical protein